MTDTEQQPQGSQALADFCEHIPAPNDRLHRIVHRMAHMHFKSPLAPRRLTPDSYIKLSLILDGVPRYFNGQGHALDWHDGITGHILPRQGIVATSDGPVRCVVANFYPSAFHRMFGGPVERFNGVMIPVEQIFGTATSRLYANVRAAVDPQGAVDVVMRLLMDMTTMRVSGPPSPIAQLEHHIRERKGKVLVNELADLVDLSQRQLQRRFKEEIGLSPKAFCSVVRFNHVYSEMKRKGKLDLDVALASGYFDESHMMKDLSYFLGKTPKRFVSLIRPWWT